MATNHQVEMLREKGYVPATEAADKAGMTVYTMYRWAAEKKVEGMKVGKHWYILLSSLVTYLGPKASTLLGLTNQRGKVL